MFNSKVIMMTSKIKLSVVGIIGGIILVSLLFISTDEVFEINFQNSESPLPVIVLNNYNDLFDVTSISCRVDSSSLEIKFSISNKLDKNYQLELYLLQMGINNENLSRNKILVETTAGKTISETHQVYLQQDLNTCGIEINRIIDITD